MFGPFIPEQLWTLVKIYRSKHVNARIEFLQRSASDIKLPLAISQNEIFLVNDPSLLETLLTGISPAQIICIVPQSKPLEERIGKFISIPPTALRQLRFITGPDKEIISPLHVDKSRIFTIDILSLQGFLSNFHDSNLNTYSLEKFISSSI